MLDTHTYLLLRNTSAYLHLTSISTYIFISIQHSVMHCDLCVAPEVLAICKLSLAPPPPSLSLSLPSSPPLLPHPTPNLFTQSSSTYTVRKTQKLFALLNQIEITFLHIYGYPYLKFIYTKYTMPNHSLLFILYLIY